MSWTLTGFAKDNEALTHDVNLDDALGALLRLPTGEHGPVYLDDDAVVALATLLSLPFDVARSRHVIEKEPPRGWVIREIEPSHLVEEVDVDRELSRVIAELCGEDLAYMRGLAQGAAFPLDRRPFDRLTRMFALDLEWDGVEWFVEEFANPVPDA